MVHKLLGFKDFSQSLGMLTSTTNAAKSTQNCAKLPKFAKFYPKTIILRNFEMSPKIEILVFLKNKSFMCRGSTRVCIHYLDFQYNNFSCLFYCQKTAFVCEFQHIPLRKMIFFSMFHTSCEYEILWTCTSLTY
jgi:hypothetical protein